MPSAVPVEANSGGVYVGNGKGSATFNLQKIKVRIIRSVDTGFYALLSEVAIKVLSSSEKMKHTNKLCFDDTNAIFCTL